MWQHLKKFIIKEFIISLVILISGFIFFKKYDEYYLTIFPFLLLLFFTLTLIVHYVLIKASFGNPRKFPRTFLLISGLKLFILLIVLLIFLFKYKSSMVEFAAVFIIFYLVFQVFEVISILSYLKNNK